MTPSAYISRKAILAGLGPVHPGIKQRRNKSLLYSQIANGQNPFCRLRFARASHARQSHLLWRGTENLLEVRRLVQHLKILTCNTFSLPG